MQRTTKAHWASIILVILSASILLLTPLTTPVIHEPHADWSLYTMVLMKPDQDQEHAVIRWGSFGSCHNTIVNGKTSTRCTDSSVGYSTCSAMYDGRRFKAPIDERCGTADDLSHGMVLHPIASAMAFAAAFVAMVAKCGGPMAGGILAFLAWMFTVIAVAIDLAVFKIVEKRSNALGEYADFTVLGRHYGPIMYCLIGALILLTAGAPLMLYSSFAARKAEKEINAPVDFHSLGSVDSVAMVDEKDCIHRP